MKAYPSLNSYGGLPAFDQLFQTLPYFSFSMCLIGANAVLELGTDYSCDAAVVWSPIVSGNGYYTLGLNDVMVENVSLLRYPTLWRCYFTCFCLSPHLTLFHLLLFECSKSPPSQTSMREMIVDSGTTLFVLQQDIYYYLKAEFIKYCSFANLPGVCNVDPQSTIFEHQPIKANASILAQFPTIFVILEGVKLAISGFEYLRSQDNETYYFGIGILNGGSFGKFKKKKKETFCGELHLKRHPNL